MTLFLTAVIAAILFSLLCSISEAALLSVTQAEVQALGDEGAGARLRRFKKEIDEPISAILVLNTFANGLGVSLASASYVELFGSETLPQFSLGLIVAILLLGEIVPKTLGAVHTQRVIVPVVWFVTVLVVLLKPLTWLLRLLTRSLRGDDSPVTSIQEIRLLAALGKNEGAVAAGTARMIEGAARLKELEAYDVMVPRTAMVLLSGEEPFSQSLDRIKASGHSRLPYSRKGDPDHLDGLVLSRDVLLHSLDLLVEQPAAKDWPSSQVLDDLARKVEFVPEGTPVEGLLHLFQAEQLHLAIVVDEYGGTEGIVTLEDVLEEVVGEIFDEKDAALTHMLKREDGNLVLRGAAEVRKLFDLTGVKDDDEIESVTVRGLVAELLEHVPKVGETASYQNLQFRVLRANARGAERVLCEVRDSTPDSQSEN